MPAAFGFVLNDKDEVLLIQRGYGKHKGKWSLPGGNQDRGESLKRTAVRETLEETRIRMTADVLFYKGRRHNFEIWRGRNIGGRLKYQNRECLDASWFKEDMLPADECLAFGPDKIVMGKWASENHGSRRVHYPHAKMRRAGFALVVNNRRDILLVRQNRGKRAGNWSLPWSKPGHGQGRLDAAVFGAYKSTSIIAAIDRLYYENRHRGRIYLGKPANAGALNPNARWFALNELPDDEHLAYAVDVRTVEKWARDNGVARH